MIVDADTAVLLRFDEAATAIQPLDATGHLAGLLVPAGFTPPPMVDGMLGRARAFGTTQAFIATESVVGSTKLLRSMTIQAIISFAVGRSEATGHTVVTRGLNTGSAAERLLWSLFIFGSGGGSTATLQTSWVDATGGAGSVTSPSFDLPAAVLAGGMMHIAVIRRWFSTTSIEFEFVVNGTSVGVVASVVGNFGGGDGGHVTVGYADLGTGGTGYFKDAIDEIKVSSAELSVEELRQEYRRYFVLPDEAHEVLRAFLPSGSVFGDVYSRDLSSGIQRELRVEAEGMAWGLSKAAELEEDFLPDRAWSSLSRWESVTGRSALSIDSFPTRRARVIAHLRKVHGFQRSEIVKALVGPLALTEAQIELIETSNQLNEEFNGGTIAPSWWQEVNAGTIAISGGKVTLAVQIADDSRWNATVRVPVDLRTTVAEEHQIEVIAALTPTLSEDGASCGAFISNTDGTAHLFGIRRQAGVNKWWHRTIIAGVATDTFGAAIGAGTVFWVRFLVDATGALADISHAVDPTGLPWQVGFTWVTEFAGATTFSSSTKQWSGPFMSVDLASAGANSSVDVLAFRLWCPQSVNVYLWFVYRNPALSPTSYDLKGAQGVLDQMKPGHTVGIAVESKSFLCDDPYSRCDRDPLGA